ncbi:MAG: helix-turn-helix transcriptional regulator [Bacteroidota bacterium]
MPALSAPFVSHISGKIHGRGKIQQDLADAVGMPRPSIARILTPNDTQRSETGRTTPSTLRKIVESYCHLISPDAAEISALIALGDGLPQPFPDTVRAAVAEYGRLKEQGRGGRIPERGSITASA